MLCTRNGDLRGELITPTTNGPHSPGPQVLTGFRPFHCMPGYTPVPAILRGERPKRPLDAESLGFSDALWQLTQLCWSGSSSDRPTVQQLLDHLSLAALSWVPPPVYPARVVIDTGEITGSNSSGSSGMLENPTYHIRKRATHFFSRFSQFIRSFCRLFVIR